MSASPPRHVTRRRDAGLAAAVAAFCLLPAGPAHGADLLSLCLSTAGAVAPGGLSSAWSLAPATVLPLAAVLALYLLATRKQARTRRDAAFVAGWLLLVVALVSPLCRLAATLVSAHMVQHMILVIAAPLLLAIGAAGILRGRAATFLRGGTGFAGLAYGGALWLWHAPAVYSLVLVDAVVHVAAFAILVAASTWFWSAVLANMAGRPGRAVASVFFALLHTGLLGALLTFAPTPLYPEVAAGAAPWGLTPLSDQQLAGLIMWVPGGFAYLGIALTLSMRCLADAGAFNPAAGRTMSAPSPNGSRQT